MNTKKKCSCLFSNSIARRREIKGKRVKICYIGCPIHNKSKNKTMIKKTLLIAIVLLFLSIDGWAQDTASRISNTDTLAACWDTTTYVKYLGFSSLIGSGDTSVNVKQRGTVKVIMLVCDTSNIIYSTKIGGYLTTGKSGYSMQLNTVYWQFGYEVLKFIPDGWGDYDRQIFPHWEFESYLDDKKQPLKSGIIFWQSVPAKD